MTTPRKKPSSVFFLENGQIQAVRMTGAEFDFVLAIIVGKNAFTSSMLSRQFPCSRRLRSFSRFLSRAGCKTNSLLREKYHWNADGLKG